MADGEPPVPEADVDRIPAANMTAVLLLLLLLLFIVVVVANCRLMFFLLFVS